MATKSKKDPLITIRNGRYHTNFSFDGKPVRQSLKIFADTGDKELNKANEAQAREIAAKKLSDLHAGKELSKYKHSWLEAVEQYGLFRRDNYDQILRNLDKDCSKERRSRLTKRYREYISEMIGMFEVIYPFIKDKDIDLICQADLTKLRRHLINVRKVSDPRANRYITLVRSTLTYCAKKLENEDKSKWLKTLPDFPIVKEKEGKIVELTIEKYWELYGYLSEVHQDLMTVAVSTGLRGSNILYLEKSWLHTVDGMPYVSIPSEDMKNKDVHEVPLPEKAVEAILRSCERHPDSIFVFNSERFGKPLSTCSTKGWYAALEKAGLKADFNWHKFRNVFTANCVQAKIPDSVTQRLGGWKTNKMVKRYSQGNVVALRDFTQAADTFLTLSGSEEKHISKKPLL